MKNVEGNGIWLSGNEEDEIDIENDANSVSSGLDFEEIASALESIEGRIQKSIKSANFTKCLYRILVLLTRYGFAIPELTSNIETQTS